MRRIEAQFLEAGQGSRVLKRVAEHRDGHVITAMLSLHADSTRDPPNRRMVKEQRLHHGLQQIDDEIVTADVRQLVGQDHLDLFRGQPGERGDGEEDDGTHPPDDRWYFHRR